MTIPVHSEELRLQERNLTRQTQTSRFLFVSKRPKPVVLSHDSPHRLLLIKNHVSTFRLSLVIQRLEYEY